MPAEGLEPPTNGLQIEGGGDATRFRTRLVPRRSLHRPGTIYFAPPVYHLLIEHGPSLALSVDDPVNLSRPSIDVLFESAADVYGGSLLGIILSGASADGAAGLAAVRSAGGSRDADRLR